MLGYRMLLDGHSYYSKPLTIVLQDGQNISKRQNLAQSKRSGNFWRGCGRIEAR